MSDRHIGEHMGYRVHRIPTDGVPVELQRSGDRGLLSVGAEGEELSRVALLELSELARRLAYELPESSDS